MKKILWFLFYCCIGTRLPAQSVAIQHLCTDTIFLCEMNYLKIVAQGYSNDKLIVSTNDGIINNESNGESYYFFPKRPGLATIYVSVKTKNKQIKLLDSAKYFVKRQEAFVCLSSLYFNEHATVISQDELLRAFALTIRTYRPHCNPIFGVSSYSLSIKRRNKLLYHEIVKDNRISEEATEFFYTLKKKDIVTFDAIKFEDCDKTVRKFPPLHYTIIAANKYKNIKPYNDTLRVTDPITGSEVTKIVTVTRKMVK
jgi:hypothetical protein